MQHMKALLAYAELVEPYDSIFVCGVKRLKPTREFRHRTFVDNMRTQWVISYAHTCREAAQISYDIGWV